MKVIAKHIYDSQGFKLSLLAPNIKFWQHDQITETQFIEMADTFDILLFQNKSQARKSTKYEFDHAALILKFATKPNEVFILQAIEDKGV